MFVRGQDSCEGVGELAQSDQRPIPYRVIYCWTIKKSREGGVRGEHLWLWHLSSQAIVEALLPRKYLDMCSECHFLCLQEQLLLFLIFFFFQSPNLLLFLLISPHLTEDEKEHDSGWFLVASQDEPTQSFTQFSPYLLALEIGLEIWRDISKTFYRRLKNIFHPYFFYIWCKKLSKEDLKKGVTQLVCPLAKMLACTRLRWGLGWWGEKEMVWCSFCISVRKTWQQMASW